jgi:tetratricopeptide (TPR) repeat protein
VQDDIAQSVVKELRAALLGEGIGSTADAKAKAEVLAATTGRADNPEAYRLYLQGRYYVERMTEADVARGVDYFRQAIALDPEFALAWTGLSNAYRVQAGYGFAPVAEGYERARDAAKRALALSPDLAEAHVSLAGVFGAYDWDWSAADCELQRALALAPGNVDVLRAVASLAGTVGRSDEAIELLRKAVALDPLSTGSQRSLGLRYFMSGRLDEALAALKVALDLNPKAGLIHCFLAITYVAQGRAAEALALAEREALPDFRLLGIAWTQHALGHKEASDAALAELIADHGDKAAYQIAELCTWRGQFDLGFEWLERAFVQHDPGLNQTATDPLLRPLHGDSRWLPFMNKMGFN